MARKIGQIIRLGPSIRLVRIYVGHNPDYRSSLQFSIGYPAYPLGTTRCPPRGLPPQARPSR
jgi:hypothetical protein